VGEEETKQIISRVLDFLHHDACNLSSCGCEALAIRSIVFVTLNILQLQLILTLRIALALHSVHPSKIHLSCG
jgi:hypothetical protein